MKRFIFYMIASLAYIIGIGALIWVKCDLSFDIIKNALATDLKYQILGGFIVYYIIAIYVNIAICSVRMSKKCAFSFYGRPLEFHGDTINTYDVGRITFRTKGGDLEAYNIYTTKSIDLPIYKCMFNVGVSKNGTVKTMYEVDEQKDKVGRECVRYHSFILSMLMIFIISVIPVFGIIAVLAKTHDMR